MGTIKTFDKWFDQAGLTIEKVNGNEPERRLVRGITAYFRNASNPDQTRSHEVQVVWLDEAAQMEEGVLTLTNAACRQFGNDADYQTIITSTPRGRNWLYRWFFDPATLRYSLDKFNTYRTTTAEASKHGVVRQDYIEEMGYVEGSDMYRQEVDAEFVTWAGLVFNRYDRTKHSPVPFTHPKFRAVYAGVDPGYASFTAMHLSGITPAGAIYTFKEFYKKRASPHDWMGVMGEWTKRYNVKRIYVDSAASQELRAMKAAGLPAYPAMKQKDAAGTAVGFINGKFERNELFIDREACPFLVSEIEAYQYKEVTTGDEMTFLEKVKPNQMDHGIDNWRYHVLPLAGASARTTYGALVPFAFNGRAA
jgi:phage terminase large subunit